MKNINAELAAILRFMADLIEDDRLSMASVTKLIDADSESPVVQAIASIHNYVESLPRSQRPAACTEVMQHWARLKTEHVKATTPVATFDDDEL